MSTPSDFPDRPETELEKLLWERIDGTISAADAAKLGQWTAKDPEAARLEIEITRLAAGLDGVEPEPLPDGLADEIRQGLTTVRDQAPAAGLPGEAWFTRLLGPRPERRLVLLAATLVVAVVGFQLLGGDSIREDGTLSGTAGLTEPAPEGGAMEIALPRSLGVLTLSRRDDVATMVLATTPGLPAARLEVTGTGLSVVETDREGNATFELHTGENAVQLEVTGAGKVTLSLAATGPLTVTVLDGEETLVLHSY